MDVDEDDEDEVGDWWTFYPLCGIDNTDTRHDLHKPVFGDVTLVSKRHLPQVMALLPHHSDSYETKKQRTVSLTKLVTEMADEERAKTFLAIRRRGVMHDYGYEEDQVVTESRERAYEVAALLTVVMLANSREQMTCGLAEQIYRRPDRLAMLDLEGGWYTFRLGGRLTLSPFSAEVDVPLSRAMLKRLLLRRPFAALTEILLTRRSPLPDSLRRSLKQATLRLADAIHSSTDTAQLLSAVITLELLFRVNDQEKYQVNHHRITAFLGQEEASQFSIEQIFKARHQYVHEGQAVHDEEVTYQAVVLALLCLIRYANVVAAFKSKQDFVDHLDFVYRAERRATQWDTGRKKKLRQLLGSDRNPFYLPFGPLRKEIQ